LSTDLIKQTIDFNIASTDHVSVTTDNHFKPEIKYNTS
jgi:hypothetical protein